MRLSTLLSACCAALILCAASSPISGQPIALVQTVPLQQGRLIATVTSYGTVIFDPLRTVTLSFPRAGRVSRISASSGQVVRRGEALVKFDTDPLSVESFRQAVGALKFARSELSRTESMARQKMTTQSQLAAARKALADAEATVAAQRRLGMGRVSEQLVAPFAGVVTSVAAKGGDVLAAGAPILQLARQGALIAVLGVEPEETSSMRRGMAVRLTSIFNAQRTISGTVREVHRLVDPQTRLVDVLVTLNGTKDRIVPGSRLRGEIATGTVTGWIVPRNAVLREDRGPFIYQVDAGRARLVRVTVGVERGDQVEVRGKLDPRLRVVAVGNYELSDGMAVREERP